MALAAQNRAPAQAAEEAPVRDEYVSALGQIATSIGDLLHALEQHRAVRKRGLPIEPSTLPLSRSLRVLVERALDAADASLCEPHEPKSS